MFSYCSYCPTFAHYIHIVTSILVNPVIVLSGIYYQGGDAVWTLYQISVP